MANLKFLSPHGSFFANGVAALVLFLTVGVYSTITALGAAGGKPTSNDMNHITSSALYATFTVTGYFGGTVTNLIGPKYQLAFGAFGYPFYVSSLWYYYKKSVMAYPIVGGVVLGLCAGQLWSASCYVFLFYAEEHRKGLYYGIQKTMIAFGNFISSCIVLGINYHKSKAGGVPTAIFAVFFVLDMLGVAVAFLLKNPKDIIRSSGERLAKFKVQGTMESIKGTLLLTKKPQTLFTLMPLIVAEFPLVLQPTISSYFLNLRSRSVVSVIVAALNMVFASALSQVLDLKYVTRPTRAKIGFAIVACFVIGGYMGEGIWLYHTLPSTQPESVPAYDFTSSSFGGFMICYILLSCSTIIYPVYLGWLVGTYSNDPTITSYYAGFIRSMSACGAAIAFGMAAANTISIRKQYIIHCSVSIFSLIPLLYCAVKYVTETNYGKEENVIIPEHWVKALGVEAEGDVSPDTASMVQVEMSNEEKA
ncbi:unnamed protein product [Kuraishia capsulata CBS 1993]|uniref:Uncharacterized protein n=1 Tax=Kuraishia capsulata CBS 1993 TaxID=1382522 RepID=W6MWZ9_9ASCO|nr:uncharacterized protein KUCA_T00004021001 [Kuraishia capsulata CBS 1993]CDK28040.1 unnamed protein product [Kuraishia capsulata CBS 1993]